MEEILPGLFHWTAFRDTIGSDVHSHYHEPSGTVLDPMVPPEGLEAFDDRRVERLVLTNRHHYRHADAYRERFGASVHCHEAGLHEFDAAQDVQGFAFGDELAPGVRALAVGVLTPEETAIHIDDRALAFADAVITRPDGKLAFVPGGLLGDDPQAIRTGLCAAFARLVREQAFEALLMAHGEPRRHGGRAALEAFAEAQTTGASPD